MEYDEIERILSDADLIKLELSAIKQNNLGKKRFINNTDVFDLQKCRGLLGLISAFSRELSTFINLIEVEVSQGKKPDEDYYKIVVAIAKSLNECLAPARNIIDKSKSLNKEQEPEPTSV